MPWLVHVLFFLLGLVTGAGLMCVVQLRRVAQRRRGPDGRE